RMPRPGRIALSPMLNPKGRLIGDFTVARLLGRDAGRFMIFGSGIAQDYHLRWFEAHLPADGGVAVRALGLSLTGLSIAGPKARDLLAAVTAEDVSAEAFPFLAFRRMEIGPIPALVGRISFTGDLGYEIWVAPEYQRALWDLLADRGAGFGLRPFGARALNSLRLEKSWGSWAREYRPIYGPVEAGLDRFVDFAKPGFIGRDAALRERDAGPGRRLVTLAVDVASGAEAADVIGDEPIWHAGRVVGWVTSGGYAHHSGVSVAMGYVPAALAAADSFAADSFAIEILGDRRPATILKTPLLPAMPA
ncbi:MAG TPA: aminomethyltransferase family protein, partial [Alphaproteobacteria bacterium]|nr:aminomethyltransferase family protein [Alphaproteobacteria bacterium]